MGPAAELPAFREPPGAESPATRAVIYGLSVAVCGLVAFLIYGIDSLHPAGEPTIWASANALLNFCSGVCLLLGFRFVKRGELVAHRRAMLSAFGFSLLFLIGYVLHHAQVGSVKFAGEGLVRTVYFSLLIPHVILAAVVLPMALFTVHRGWTGRIERHRKIARVTFPIWLFVSCSGVVLYFMLYHL